MLSAKYKEEEVDAMVVDIERGVYDGLLFTPPGNKKLISIQCGKIERAVNTRNRWGRFATRDAQSMRVEELTVGL
jgi:hypothetical protein